MGSCYDRVYLYIDKDIWTFGRGHLGVDSNIMYVYMYM